MPQTAHDDAAIQVHELTKVFESQSLRTVAVDRVSFYVGESEVFGLLGPNGAGKTTAMRMILGLLPADEGWASVHGFRSDREPDAVKRQVGFVTANAGVYQWLTAHEMLTFFGDVYGLSPAAIRERIETLSELLDLSPFLHQRCTTLSTGQKQRINLARAMIHDPQVMILDEPTLGLDVVGSQVIFRYIELLRQQRKAVILCTHRLEQAQRICDRFGLMHHGRLAFEGKLEQLQQQTGRQDLVDMFVDILGEPVEAS